MSIAIDEAFPAAASSAPTTIAATAEPQASHASAAAPPKHRDPTERPVFKLSSRLIETYKNINKVTSPQPCSLHAIQCLHNDLSLLFS